MNFKNLRFYTVDLTDVINTLEDDEKIENVYIIYLHLYK